MSAKRLSRLRHRLVVYFDPALPDDRALYKHLMLYLDRRRANDVVKDALREFFARGEAERYGAEASGDARMGGMSAGSWPSAGLGEGAPNDEGSIPFERGGALSEVTVATPEGSAPTSSKEAESGGGNAVAPHGIRARLGRLM